MYVSSFDYASVVDHISFALLRNDPDMSHFLQARLVIEVGMMELVTENVDEPSLLQLEECNRLIEQARSVAEASELDLDFHHQLLEIASNPILSEFGSFLGRFFVKAHQLVDGEARFRTAEGHKELIQALRRRSADQAREIMRKHILTWEHPA